MNGAGKPQADDGGSTPLGWTDPASPPRSQAGAFLCPSPSQRPNVLSVSLTSAVLPSQRPICSEKWSVVFGVFVPRLGTGLIHCAR